MAADLTYPNSTQLRRDGNLYIPTGKKIEIESGGDISVNGVSLIDEVAALNGLDSTETGFLNGVVAGTAAASKALVLNSGSAITSGITALTATTLNATTVAATTVNGTTVNAGTTLQSDSVTISPIKWVDVAVTAALLDGAGTVNVIAGVAGDQYKIRNIILVGGGTNFAAGGDRLISLTDGTTVWTTIANADIESAPAASLMWGNTKVPFLTGTSATASVAGQAIRFAYSGGTTDHSATGSITFSVCLEKVA